MPKANRAQRSTQGGRRSLSPTIKQEPKPYDWLDDCPFMEVAGHKPSLGRARKRERPSSLAIEDPNPYATLATGATGSKGEGQASVAGCNRQPNHRASKAHRGQLHREAGDGKPTSIDGHCRKGGHHLSSRTIPQQTIDAEGGGDMAQQGHRNNHRRKTGDRVHRGDSHVGISNRPRDCQSARDGSLGRKCQQTAAGTI